MATQPLHLALVIRGGYKTSAVEISDEIWVNTLNLAVQLDAFTETVGTIPDNFEVVHDDLSDTGTGWHGQSDWRLEGGISDFDPLSYLVDQVYPAVLTWMGMAGRASTSVVKQLDLYPIDTSGRAIAPAGYGAPVPASIVFDTDAGPAGSTSGQYAPLQTACACSHRTGFAGRKGRGRMFIGGLASTTIDNYGQFTTTFVNNMVAYQGAFLEALELAGSAPYVRPSLIPNGTGYANITEVRVGTVPDTQRRRRNQLTETYTSTPVTYT